MSRTGINGKAAIETKRALPATLPGGREGSHAALHLLAGECRASGGRAGVVGRAFEQGEAYLASLESGLLKVPMQNEPARLPVWFRGLLTNWLANRMEYARVNLRRLARVTYDANDQRRWFDLADQNGYSVRLLFPVGELTEKEAAVLTALRDQVIECGLEVDPETRTALGISDHRP